MITLEKNVEEERERYRKGGTKKRRGHRRKI